MQIAFFITAALILGAALMVVSARNLVHAALWLIVTLFGMAVLFVLLEAGFLAAVQVVVYIGAISILIIFAIMLTRRVMQDTGPQTNQQWPLAALIALAVFAAIVTVVTQVRYPLASAGVPETSLATLGFDLVSPNGYVVALVVIGVLLAAGMIGSIAIAKDKE